MLPSVKRLVIGTPDEMSSRFTCRAAELLSGNSNSKWPSRCFSNDLDGFFFL